MPQDIGSLLVRITADISELKKGVASAKAEIQSMKSAGSSTEGGFAGISDQIKDIASNLKGATSQIFTMFGASMSVYGVFVLLRSATQQWYELLKSGVEQIDEYRRSVYSAAGLMTSITEVGTDLTPNFQTAYNQWKEYFNWLYLQSLEASKKVSSSGKEIFQAGIEMAMRGAVPKTADQVYIVGQLTDFIKSVTRGLSEQQQMFQEIRSMFEGQMRLGAQALQKFTQIDPNFAAKFDAARTAAMRMKDATPIFELLEKTMMGIRYASTDLATTFTALYNTSKTVFQLLMMEAFAPMYDSIVKMGWALMDSIYIHGQLTQTGKDLAAGLGTAWEVVRKKIEEYVNYIINNGPEVTNTLKNAATALGHIADATITATGAMIKLVNAMALLNKTDLMLILVAAGAGGAIGGIPGAITGAALAAAGSLIGKAGQAEDMAFDKKATLLNRQDLIKQRESSSDIPAAGSMEETMDAGRIKDTFEKADKVRKDAITTLDTAWKTEIEKRAAGFDKEAKEQAAKIKALSGKPDSNKDIIALKNAAADKRNAMNELDQAAWDMAQRAQTSGVSDKAPPTGFAKIQPPKADKKGGAGRAGRTERDLDILMQLSKAERQLGILDAEEKYKIFKAENDEERAELKLKYEEGKMGAAEYYTTLRSLAQKEADGSKAILEAKKIDAQKTYEEIIALQQGKADRGTITQLEADGLKEIEAVKLKIELKKIETEIDLQKIKNQKEITNLTRQETENLKNQARFFAQLDAKTARGPISQEQAQMKAYRTETEQKAYKLGINPNDTPEQWSAVQKSIELRNIQIQYGKAIDKMIDSITTGIEGIVEALMEGGANLKQNMMKAANTMFKGIFKAGFEQSFKELKEDLTKAFDSMFEGMGGQLAGALMGVIGMIGMMLTSGSKKSSFTPSGVQSQVTGHEAVRGVIAGETSIPIAQIGTALAEALVPTNGILSQIEANTRGLQGLSLNLNVSIAGLEEMMTKALEDYFAKMGMTGK